MIDKFISVDIAVHESGNLFLATSKDLSGLMVHGKTLDELWARIPPAVKIMVDSNLDKT